MSDMAEPEYLSQARADLIRAQIVGQEADNRLSEALAATAQLAANRDERLARWELASGNNYRKYYLGGNIEVNNVLNTIDVLSRWDRMDIEDGADHRPYHINLCSPGGDVIHGYQLYSYLKGLSQRRKVIITASGICASMATIIHQAATPGERVIEPGCTYLLHEVSGGTAGRFDSIADTADWMRQLNENMYNIFAENSHLTADEIRERVSRREKFLTPTEVIEWGLADRVEYTA